LNNIKLIFEKGFNKLIIESDEESLNLLFKFLLKVDKLDFLKSNLKFVIKEHGKTLVMQ
jgi:hypothetical protein